jgi:ABC-type sugar transport system permease subunit
VWILQPQSGLLNRALSYLGIKSPGWLVDRSSRSPPCTFRITIPLLSPVILFNVVLYVIGIFQSFAESFIITQGGPENSTLFYSRYL